MDQYIYFWKPRDNNGYLSNWYYSPFQKHGIRFLNSEQYFMWRKQQLFDPSNTILEGEILLTNNPKVMKDFGRKVKNFDQKLWDNEKYEIMREALMEKFSQNYKLKKLLINTGKKILVEASPYDRVWGIGLNERNARRKFPWNGDNLLGKALMDVREDLSND